MRKERKDKHFLHKPTYPGGIKAIRAFIGEYLKYPEEALEHRIEGSVYLRYDINYKGEVIEAKVISGLGYGCDEEAVRLVKRLCFEVAKTRGLKVVFHKNIRIHFNLPKNLPKEEQPKAQVQVQYSYSPSTKNKGTKNEDSGKNNGYTISF